MMDPDKNVKRRKEVWPLAIAGFFAVAIAGCVAFVVFCLHHPEELVARDYYEREMRHQSQMDRALRGQAIVSPGAIRYDSARNAILITLPAAHARAGVAGAVCLYRPSSAALDRRFDLGLDEQGNQAIDARELKPGLWRVQVSWEADGRDYYTEERIELKSGNG